MRRPYLTHTARLRKRAFILIDLRCSGEKRRSAREQVRSYGQADAPETWAQLGRMIMELENMPDIPKSERVRGLTDDQKEAIRWAHSRGASVRGLADMYDCSVDTIKRALGLAER